MSPSLTCDKCGSNDNPRMAYCNECYDALQDEVDDLKAEITRLRVETSSLRNKVIKPREAE